MATSRAGTAKKGKQKNDLLQAHEENKRNAEDENDMYLRVKDHVFNYFQETTVHGFRYVVEGQNSFERGIWIVFIICAITYAATLIRTSLIENTLNPIVTTIESIPTKQVPFPAVTLDGGQVMNPLAYAEKSQNMLTADTFDFEMLLQTYYHNVTRAFVADLEELLQDFSVLLEIREENMTPERMKDVWVNPDWKPEDETRTRFVFPKYVFRYGKPPYSAKIGKYASFMAAVEMQDPKMARELYFDIFEDVMREWLIDDDTDDETGLNIIKAYVAERNLTIPESLYKEIPGSTHGVEGDCAPSGLSDENVVRYQKCKKALATAMSWTMALEMFDEHSQMDQTYGYFVANYAKRLRNELIFNGFSDYEEDECHSCLATLPEAPECDRFSRQDRTCFDDFFTPLNNLEEQKATDKEEHGYNKQRFNRRFANDLFQTGKSIVVAEEQVRLQKRKDFLAANKDKFGKCASVCSNDQMDYREKVEMRRFMKLLAEKVLELDFDLLELSTYEFMQLLDLPIRRRTDDNVDEYAHVIGYNHCPTYYFEPSENKSMHLCDEILDKREEYEARGEKDLVTCCTLRVNVRDQHVKALKLMKYSQQPPNLFQALEEYLTDFGKYNVHINYNNSRDWGNKGIYLATYNPRILSCDKGENPEMRPEQCRLFHRQITNFGVGYSFNVIDWEDAYQKNAYTDMLLKYLFPKSRKKKIDLVYAPSTSGQQSYLKMTLQLNKMYDAHEPLRAIERPSVREITDAFRISLHDPESAPDLRSDFISLTTGYNYNILVTPTQLSGDDDIGTLSLEDRKCRFRDDNSSLTLYRKYSKGACYMECDLKLAYEACGCVPWNYPGHVLPNGKLTDLCDTSGYSCFEEVMKRPPREGVCTCLPNCEEYIYAYSITAKPMIHSDYCHPISPKEDKAYFTDLTNDDFGFQFYNTWYAAVYLNAKDIRRRINPNPNTDKDQLKMADVCRWRMEHSAYIEIQKSTADVSAINKHKRMTFTGALSNLGGLIGLFTGMSMLSVFEIIFWTGRLLGRCNILKPLEKLRRRGNTPGAEKPELDAF